MHQHIPKEVVEEYRESLKSEYASRQFHLKHPDFCEKTMDYFEKMGHFAENAATKEDLEQHWEHIQDVLGRQKDINSTLDRRVGNLEQRVNYIEQLSTHTKLAVDGNTELVKQGNALTVSMGDRINSLHDHLKQFTDNPQSKPRPQKPKFSFSSISNVGWVVIGIVSIAILAAITGTMTDFFAWDFKGLGGS